MLFFSFQQTTTSQHRQKSHRLKSIQTNLLSTNISYHIHRHKLSSMDNNAILVMLPQLLEAQREFFASQTLLINMLIDERKDKKNVIQELSNRPTIINRIIKLTGKDDFVEWRTALFTTLKMAGLAGHILKDGPVPTAKADLEKWETERAEVDFFIQSSVDVYAVWAKLKTKGWATTTRNPKVTFDMLTEYFF
jgi:hypothetical protein